MINVNNVNIIPHNDDEDKTQEKIKIVIFVFWDEIYRDLEGIIFSIFV